MSVRTLSIMGLLLGVLCAILILYYGMFVGMSIRFTNEDIQKALDERLPKTVRGVTIEKVVTELDGQLSAMATIATTRWGQDINAVISAKGVPRYSPFHGTFYFEPEDVRVESFRFGESSVKEKIDAAADRYVTNTGLNTLVIDLSPMIERHLKGAAERSMVYAMSIMPAYKLPETTSGYIARTVLSDVRVEGKQVVVTFTLMRLVWWMGVIAICTLGAIALLVGIFRSPGWGMGTLLLFD